MEQNESQIGKVIAMTSASPKEGKSTIAFNTSIIFAQLGYRVLLIDGDLYQSRITELCVNSPLFSSLDFSSPAGLTDAIAGVDNWQDLIKRAPQLKLDILLSGSPAVNSISKGKGIYSWKSMNRKIVKLFSRFYFSGTLFIIFMRFLKNY